MLKGANISNILELFNNDYDIRSITGL